VGEEIEIWKTRSLPENLFIAVTEGEIEWDIDRQSFNWEKSNALHPNLKGMFSREPLWVDLRWARGERDLSPRDPRFQRATAMLAAPMHGKTLDELVGEDVHQHRKTQKLVGLTVGALTLLLILSILATLIAWNMNQNLQSKLTLIENVFPFFNVLETGSEVASDKWSSIRSYLLKHRYIEEWIDWGPDRLAVVEDCFSVQKEKDNDINCPKLKSEFDHDGLRADVDGLNAMARTFVSSLNDSRIKQLLMANWSKDFDPTQTDSHQEVESDLDSFFGHAGILLSDKLWQQLAITTGGRERVGGFHTRRSFNIWRRPLDGARGGAELVVIRLIDTGYCGTSGCTSPTIGFLRVGKKYELILAQVSYGNIAVYDGGRGNMPQIFTIASTQSGASDQFRTLLRYKFDGHCVCYQPYLAGSIRSSESGSDQRVPQL